VYYDWLELPNRLVVKQPCGQLEGIFGILLSTKINLYYTVPISMYDDHCAKYIQIKYSDSFLLDSDNLMNYVSISNQIFYGSLIIVNCALAS